VDNTFSLAGLTLKPAELLLPDEKAAERFYGFFTANIRNKTRGGSIIKPRAGFRSGARAGDSLTLRGSNRRTSSPMSKCWDYSALWGALPVRRTA
jgi:hypothetical protein